jgi:HSP20 family protein
MSNLIRWGPMREVASMRGMMDRIFDDLYSRQSGLNELGFPAVDLYQNENDVVVKATLPGVKPDDIQISVSGDTLTVRGEVKQEEQTKEKNYIIRERSYGLFSRSITLPVAVLADKAQAEFAHGVLTLTLPKAEETKPRTIKVIAK